MPILSILQEKGGSGKTTIAVNLARGLQLAGHDVMLADSDPQGSARDWKAMAEQHERNAFPVIGLDRAALFHDIEKIAQNTDWCIVDGAPSIEALAVEAIRVSDYVIIPVQPSPYDVWASESLAELVRTRQRLANGKPYASFIVSRQIINTKLAAEVRVAILDYQLPLMESLTSQRVIYSSSVAEGSTVIDDEPDGNAAKEVQAIVQEVLQWH